MTCCAHAGNSTFRVGTDGRYRLLARAIDTTTGIALAQAVSESFQVSFQLLWQIHAYSPFTFFKLNLDRPVVQGIPQWLQA